jgi:hypothetical protein
MRTTILFLALLTSAAARAADVWIVRGSAGPPLGACDGVRWTVDALLHNRSVSDATVRLLHVSNGGSGLLTALMVPGNQSLPAGPVSGTADALLWVARLDVPANVAVEGRLEYFAPSCAAGQPIPIPAGRLTLPVFTRLVPAGEEQFHPGTDLGAQKVRLNVAVYNASARPALATVAVHRPVCGREPIRRVESTPADTLVQIAIPEVVPCTLRTTAPDWAPRRRRRY